jgi:hypothetical protein
MSVSRQVSKYGSVIESMYSFNQLSMTENNIGNMQENKTGILMLERLFKI